MNGQITNSGQSPLSSWLVDQYGRYARDLRISVTDRCNLRCSYCIPPDADDWLPAADFLSASEIARLTGIALDLGVKKVRLTGGEPLLRPDLAQIISALKTEFEQRSLPPEIALTTNGIGLKPRLSQLIAAGVQRINLSLDSLDPQRFQLLTHRNQFANTLAGIEAAVESGLNPIKINTVILDQTTLDEIPTLIDFCLSRGLQWRAIEFMPIGPLAKTRNSPTRTEILSKIEEHYTLEPMATDPSAPARRWRVKEKSQPTTATSAGSLKTGVIGLISSMSSPFCADCTRTRLSADGKIYSCLFSTKFIDLATPLRAGATDREIADLWRAATWEKPAGHQVLGPVDSHYRMSKIGG